MRNYRKLPSHMQAAADKATAERKLCRDGLRSLMRVSPVKTQTKADLRAEAMARFKVSRNAFDPGWDWAIMDSGNHAWWEPLKRAKNAPPATRLP